MTKQNKKNIENQNYQKSNIGRSIDFIKINKYPLLITLSFLITFLYVDIFINIYWMNYDGYYYINQGNAILAGNGQDIKAWNAPIGGPVIYATVNSFLQDGFLTLKLFSVFGGAGIVFLSYFITKNIFNPKIALLTQLFVVVNTSLHWITIQAGNELLALFLIIFSFYFITKKQLVKKDLLILGILLGAAFLIRFQTSLVLISFLLFLLIRNRNYKINFTHVGLVVGVFLVVVSPLFIYNYETYGKIIDSDPAGQAIVTWTIQTTEWREKAEVLGLNQQGVSALFLDFELFLENYFYNLFYHNSNRLFNFHTTYNLSILPYFQYIGIIPIVLGLFYYLKIKPTRNIIFASITSFVVTAFLITLFGDMKIHFFALVIIPILVLSILNIKKIQKNFLPLLILSTVFFLGAAILPLARSDHLFPMWIPIPILGAIFFLEVLPKIFTKIRHGEYSVEKIPYFKIIIIIIILVLLINIVFSMRMQEMWLFDDFELGLKDSILGLIYDQKSRSMWGEEIKEIGEVLAKQPGIENSYVMGIVATYSYYADSKFVYADFQGGVKGDSIEKYITRENWSDYEIYYSNLNSHPPDRRNENNPIPDYVVYLPMEPFAKLDYAETQYEDLKKLADPKHPEIPENFEFLYKDNKTGSVVYKIHHEK